MRKSVLAPVLAMMAFSFALCLNAQQPVKAPPKSSEGKSADKEQEVKPEVKVSEPVKTDMRHGEALKLVEEVKAKLSKQAVERRFPSQKPAADPKKKEDEESDQLSGFQFSTYSSRMAFMSKTLNVEEDSEISRKWFAELASALGSLAKFKTDMERAVDDRNPAAYPKAVEGFEKVLAHTKELIANPVKLGKDELRKVKEANAKVRSKLRAEAAAEEARKRKAEKAN